MTRALATPLDRQELMTPIAPHLLDEASAVYPIPPWTGKHLEGRRISLSRKNEAPPGCPQKQPGERLCAIRAPREIHPPTGKNDVPVSSSTASDATDGAVLAAVLICCSTATLPSSKSRLPAT